ncbi:VOC family protein [Paenibacillus sp. 32352]|uniref:VOC family protein n=1 Tax=Paenibacillus sp. 32352 TaxID=1969111 RepID=UPI0009AE3737|nr:VOC family protein [Paenibacillus sp. 32352]
MLIKRIGHLALTVEDMVKSLHFYCDVLGFAKAFELHDAEDKPWIVYLRVCEGQFLELFYGGLNKPEPVHRPIGFNHLCLEVENIDEIAGHLKKHGIPLDVEPKQGKDTNYQCWARDPDGNRIEFMQLMPGSPQMRGHQSEIEQ